MARIELTHISKRFRKVIALRDINFQVEDMEFFVLFGPAGAGKTTILKIIAGIEFPDEGLIKINDEVVNLVEPAQRNVSMVFENYALYPHFTVYDNIASPMRSPRHKTDEATIRKEVRRVAEMLKIEHLLDRMPAQISNGQKQRVAIGRCLVRNPSVFLMDEPLAHLDAKLRHFMRAEMKGLQADFNTTTIYVTHDYMEALSLGDRIAVINKGEIEQIGSANEVYYTPANQFVARLFGEPEINIFGVDLIEKENRLKLKIPGYEHLFDLEPDVERMLLKYNVRELNLGIRGTCISYAFAKEDDDFIPGTVYSLEPIGNMSILIVDINGEYIRIVAPNDLDVELDSDIFVKFDLKKALFFDRASETFIARHNRVHYVSEAA
ncbi:MAG: ABC transporter ATP-binding protein [Candidatus Neomarinimicrobiota bacterium]|nr:MAG: ABC transporter ATP-binding protein [Candidatus Neomarinimicrobiota bacterium]